MTFAMVLHRDVVQDKAGNAISAASVAVKNQDGTAATIYADEDGASTIAGGIVQSDSSGVFSFYIEPGTYDLTVTPVGSAPQSVPNVAIGQQTRVGSVAELLLIPPPKRKTVIHLEGYSAPGDGGGSSLVWMPSSTKAHDGVLVFSPSTSPANGRWERAPVGHLAPEWAGAVGDGTTNDQPALLRAASTGYHVRLTPGRTYALGATLILASGTGVLAERDATLRVLAGVNNHAIRIADGADKVTISGVVIDGNKTGNTGGNCIATGGAGATNISITGCFVKDASAHGIHIAGTTVSGINVVGNYATGCASAGITANDTVQQFKFDGNFCWSNGTHGVGIIGFAKHGSISGNIAWDNGVGDPTADNITGYNASNEDISVIGNVTKGGLNNGIHVGGTRISVIGNSTYGAAKHGIAVWPDSGAGDDITVSNNRAYGSGLCGFWLLNCNDGIFSNNLARNNTEDGALIDNCTDIEIVGNTLRGNGGDGIRMRNACAWLTMSGNGSRSNGGDGIDLADSTFCTLNGNTIRSNTGWGINRSAGEANNNISAGIVRSNTAGQLAQFAVTTRVEKVDTGESRTIASAATLSILPCGDYFYVTGTSNITSIPASFPDRRITLQFDDALTVVDGSNLRLAGNFVTTFMDTLTLVSDGTNWIECSRSPN